MDKASIIKDAVDYIKDLQQEERRILDEISALEHWGLETKTNSVFKNNDQVLFSLSSALLRSKKKKKASSDQLHNRHYPSEGSPVEDLEVTNFLNTL